MFSDDRSSETLQQLVVEIKQYIALQKEYGKLELVEKLTVIVSTIAMLTIAVILGLMTLFYLLISLAYVLEPHVGGLKVSYAIIAGISLILIVITILLKKQLFVRPMIKFLTNLFFNDSKK